MDAVINIGATGGFGSQANMQKVLRDKNGKFLQFEQEATLQCSSGFLLNRPVI